MKSKKILVCGGGGFIGHHLAKRLKEQGHWVVVVDIKSREEASEYVDTTTYCDLYISGDLSDSKTWSSLASISPLDEVYQLAADMGGAGFVFTGDNDYSIMSTSAMINLLAVNYAIRWRSKIFYSSSACIYPAYNQEDPLNPLCAESSAYPANPDSEYGWEKLFSERLYMAAHKNQNLDIRIARFHNIFGPEGTYKGGREKAPAALCRKVIEATSKIEVWGPGTQTRSFLYIDECIEAVLKLMESDHKEPLNIGSEEMISINDLAKMIASISGKDIVIENIPGPIGVMGRNSDNTILRNILGWEPTQSLKEGIERTYNWIKHQYDSQK